MTTGTFTDIFHPNNEKLFQNASIDVIVFRYCKNNSIEKTCKYNNCVCRIINSDGMITFTRNDLVMDMVMFQDYFDIYVGMVSGKESVFKNNGLGNIKVLNGFEKLENYICIESFPCDDEKVNTHLLEHKADLMKRGIRKFSEKNWYEWGALRNVSSVEKNIDQDCIYIYNLTRKSVVAFVGKVNYFGGSLIMLQPKKKCNLTKVVAFINSDTFKENFVFSNRFKIGHRQISRSLFPADAI